MVTYGYIHVISILSTNGDTAYLVVDCSCLFVYLFVRVQVQRTAENVADSQHTQQTVTRHDWRH